MNEETKAASVDSPEFRELVREYAMYYADHKPTSAIKAGQAFYALITHINAWGNQLAASRAMLPVTDSVQLLQNVVADVLPMLRGSGYPKTADVLEIATREVAASPVAGWVSAEKDGVVEQLRKALRESQLEHGSYGPHYSGEALAERIEAIIASIAPPAPVTPKQEQS